MDATKKFLENTFLYEGKIKRVIAIYPGRFQPFGSHHHKTFQLFQKQFGAQNTFIATSNKTGDKSPFNFKEKKKIISSYGVNPSNIVQVKNPYVADEITKQFDPETTAVVFLVGKKDIDRIKFGKYFMKYSDDKNKLVGYKEHGYVKLAPHISLKVGGKELSGTEIRNLLGAKNVSTDDRKKLFKSIFGSFRNDIFKLVTNKLGVKESYVISGDLIESFLINNDVKKLLSEASTALGSEVDDGPATFHRNYQWYKNQSDGIAERLGMEVINYMISGKKEISEVGRDSRVVDVVAFGKAGTGEGVKDPVGAYKKHIARVAERLGYKIIDFLGIDGNKIEDGVPVEAPKQYTRPPAQVSKKAEKEDISETINNFIETVITESNENDYIVDFDSTVRHGITMPTIRVAVHGTNRLDALAKAVDQLIIRSKNKRSIRDLIDRGLLQAKIQMIKKGEEEMDENIISEGGAAGHMAHIFDDRHLTFGDIKKIIDLGLQGKLDVEENVSEKTDGQNLLITWKDGKLKAARNKTQIKDPIDIKGIQTKFDGRGDIHDAFVFAMKDLQNAIKGLSDKQKEKIFRGGKAFMNLEIIYPATANVINYDKAVLQFHGANLYDDKANIISAVPDAARTLQGMIKQTNQDVQKHFKIIKPQILNLKRHQDFAAKKSSFNDKLKKLQSKFKLKDNDTLALYHQKWWEDFITKQAKTVKYKIPNKAFKGLVKRWAFFDKSYSVSDIKKDIKDEKFLDLVLKFDKQDHAREVKNNMFPFEALVGELGAEILKNASNILAASPEKAAQKIRVELDKTIKDIQKKGDPKKLELLKIQLNKIKAMGGFKNIFPTEGLVFKYKGKYFKITSTFAPINQILGTLKF